MNEYQSNRAAINFVQSASNYSTSFESYFLKSKEAQSLANKISFKK